MEKLRDVTLVFLIKSKDSRIAEICLAMKKRGFGAGRWNGVGGKVEGNESIIDAAKREEKEEIGVDIKYLKKIGELSFYFSHNPEWNQKVSIFFSDDWRGEPIESEEMRPQWFEVESIPFSEMWPDDKFWLPKVVDGNLIKGSFTFGENDVIEDQKIEIVGGFN